MAQQQNLQTATFGGGCFWCTEAIFNQLRGVESVVSGYAGGHVEDPTYEQVCSGVTGHAEVVQIQFDPVQIAYKELLEVFFATHDPTTLNRQGNDIGEQYRSVVFYHTDEQKNAVAEIIRNYNLSGRFSAPIVTKVEAFTNFYPASAYHQDYFAQNPTAPYCSLVISPKIKKFKEKFGGKVAG